MRVNVKNINTIEETYLLFSNDSEILTDVYVTKGEKHIKVLEVWRFIIDKIRKVLSPYQTHYVTLFFYNMPN